MLPDDAVSKGGCRVETDQSLVEFTVERRFEAMIEQLLDKQLQGEPEQALELAPEPVVKPVSPPKAKAPEETIQASEEPVDDEPGLLEQVEHLRQGVTVPPAPLLRSGT